MKSRLTGFTLIEVLVGMALMALVTTLLSGILYNGVIALSAADVTQQRTQLIFESLVTTIGPHAKEAISASSTNSPPTLTLVTPTLKADGTHDLVATDTFTYSLNGTDLRETIAAGAGSVRTSQQITIANRVSAASFTTQTLANGQSLTTVSITFTQTSYGRTVTKTFRRTIGGRNA